MSTPDPRAALLHVVHDTTDTTPAPGPLTIDPTPEGATVGLAPDTAVTLALVLINEGTAEAFARMAAAACSTHPDVTSKGVHALARLLAAHVRVDLDGRDLDVTVDQLDDAACIIPAPADPVEATARDAADRHLDLMRGK